MISGVNALARLRVETMKLTPPTGKSRFYKKTRTIGQSP